MDKNYAAYLLTKSRQDYEIIAKEFSNTREEIWPETRFLFDEYLISGEKVLDLGCGNGRYFPIFKEKNVDYFGADSSEEIIQIAKEKFPEGRFQINEALGLPFPDNSFDKVYSIAVLHQIPSEEFRDQFLNEAKRVLKPGGLLVLTVWHFHRLKEYHLLFKYTILKLILKSKLDWRDLFEPWGKKTKRYYHWFSRRELASLVKKSGLKIKNIGIIKNKRGNRQNVYLVAEKMSP